MAKSTATSFLGRARRALSLVAPARSEALWRLERRLAKRLGRRIDKLERRLTKRLKRVEGRLERRLTKRLKRVESRLGRAMESKDSKDSATAVGRVDYPGAAIELKARTVRECFRLRATEKEPWTVDWLDGSVHPGECVYDVGANVGAYSLIAAMGGARAQVVAFEPGFASFATLCENIAHNRVDDRVTPLPLALSDATELATLTYSALGSGEAMHRLGPRDISGAGVFRQPLLTYRLDDVVERFGLRPPDHLKVDVDGNEVAALRGAERTLASATLRSVMVEVEAEDAKAIEALLRKAGLECTVQTERRVKDAKRVDHWYELWVRPEGPGLRADR